MLILQESQVTFTRKSGLDQIVHLYAKKTEINGIKSFSWLPKLTSAYLVDSGFSEFPSHFGKLKKLCSFVSGATTSGEIDLNNLDFKLNPCLEIIEFHSWNNNMKGIPKNFENLKSIKIEHPNLTEEERKRLK